MFDLFLFGVIVGIVIGYLVSPYIDRVIEWRNKHIKKK